MANYVHGRLDRQAGRLHPNQRPRDSHTRGQDFSRKGKAELEYEKYHALQLAEPSRVELDFEKAIKLLPKKSLTKTVTKKRSKDKQ